MRRPALRILKYEFESASGAKTWNRRRRERDNYRMWNRREYGRDALHDSAQTQFRRIALAPRIEDRDQKAGVGHHGGYQHRIANDRDHIIEAGGVLEDALDLSNECRGPRQSRAIWQAHVDKDRPLVFLRNEPGSRRCTKERRAAEHRADEEKGHKRSAY